MNSIFDFSFKPRIKFLFKYPLSYIKRYLKYYRLKKIIKKRKNLNDVAAITAVFRPGPLSTNFRSNYEDN